MLLWDFGGSFMHRRDGKSIADRRIEHRVTAMGRAKKYKPSALVLALSTVIVFAALSCWLPQVYAARPRVLLSDHFASDRSLNPALWSTGTSLMKALAHKQSFLISSQWVAPQLRFSESGMTMSGVSNRYQFTGVQSNGDFRSPFIVEFTVRASVANGNPFMFFLVSRNSSEALSISGNMNSRNAGYYGIRLTSGSGLASLLSSVLYPSPALNVRYSVRISVNAEGKGSVRLTSASGDLLGYLKNLPVGTGPFYLVLAQYEGLPNSGAGPNSATWGSIEVTAGVP